MSRSAGVAAAAALLLALAGGCGDEPATTSVSDAPVRYEADLTVLESPDHGPHLCSNVADSLPPQCAGLPVAGWDWDAVDDEESSNGTTWGGWHVVGTYENGTFHLTERPTTPHPVPPPTPDFSPACAEPEVVDAADSRAAWDAMAGEGLDLPDEVAMWVSGAGPGGGRFVVNVIVTEGAAEATRDAIRRRYGGALCVVEQGRVRRRDLTRIQEEIFDDDARVALGQVQSAGVRGRDATLTATVWVADERAEAYAEKRWGGLVELEPILRPVRSR